MREKKNEGEVSSFDTSPDYVLLKRAVFSKYIFVSSVKTVEQETTGKGNISGFVIGFEDTKLFLKDHISGGRHFRVMHAWTSQTSC